MVKVSSISMHHRRNSRRRGLKLTGTAAARNQTTRSHDDRRVGSRRCNMVTVRPSSIGRTGSDGHLVLSCLKVAQPEVSQHGVPHSGPFRATIQPKATFNGRGSMTSRTSLRCIWIFKEKLGCPPAAGYNAVIVVV